MPDKGHDLNTQVASLFERAGFQTKPSTSDPTEETVLLSAGKPRTVDLTASALGVKIIASNKSGKNVPQPFTSHVNDWEMLKKAAKADTVLFVVTGKELSPDDRRYIQQRGMTLWGHQELQYYEALVAAIGDFAKYEIIHALRLTTDEEANTHNILALRIRQPFSKSLTDLFLFSVTPETLLKTCVVLRRAQGNKDAYQRILKKSRLGSIRRFVSQPDALLPTSIVVHLGDNVSWAPIPVREKDSSGSPVNLSKKSDCELVRLSLPLRYASLALIDGQHRLFGFVSADAATKQYFNLPVTGVTGISPAKQTDTFVAINDNSRRMDPNLVAFLKLTEDEAACQQDNELMAIRVVALLSETTPFKGKIRMLDIGHQQITLKGFAAYDLKGLLGERGALRRAYPSNTSEEYTTALRTYFGVLKSMFPKQWDDPQKYIIFTNRGIAAFLKLLRSLLKTTKGPIDEQSVHKYLAPLRKKWSDSKWETRNLKSSYVGSKGWKDFYRDIVAPIKEKFPEFRA